MFIAGGGGGVGCGYYWGKLKQRTKKGSAQRCNEIAFPCSKRRTESVPWETGLPSEVLSNYTLNIKNSSGTQEENSRLCAGTHTAVSSAPHPRAMSIKHRG